MLPQGAVELSPHLLQQEAPEVTVTLVRVMEVAPAPVIVADTPTMGCTAQLTDSRVIDVGLLNDPVKLIIVPE